MSTLFDYLLPDFGPKQTANWGATSSKDDAGKIIQVRGRGRTAPYWIVMLPYARSVTDPDYAADMAAFQSELRSLKGGSVSCYFYTPSPWDWWDGAPAGSGDATNLLFPFGGCSVQTDVAPVVYVAGVLQLSSTYSIAAIVSDNLNRWQVTFNSGHAPANGAAVTVSFKGRRLLLGFLLTNSIDFTVPGYAQTSFQIQLQGEEV